MTTYEIIATVIAGISALISISSIFSARAAHAQAKHAQSQAKTAIAQAKSSAHQVAIMRKGMAVDHISRAILARRTALDLDRAVSDLRQAVQAQQPNEMQKFVVMVPELAKHLEDTPPVFSKNVRSLIFHYVKELDGQYAAIQLNKAGPLVFDNLKIEFDRLLAAINIAIETDIQALPT